MPNPELRSLYEISLLPIQKNLQDYFSRVMTILSEYFSIGYSVLFLHDTKKEVLRLEGIFGVKKENHPSSCPKERGIVGEVLKSQKPMVISNLTQEPLYEEMTKASKINIQIDPPLFCIPLFSEDQSIGLIILPPLYRMKDKFTENLRFLSVLSALLSPTIRKYYFKEEETKAKHSKAKLRTSLLEEILAERLNEVLNRIDPYVEAKNRIGLLDEIIGLVEKMMIQSALKRVNFIQTSAAQLLGINRNTLRAKMKYYKINSH